MIDRGFSVIYQEAFWEMTRPLKHREDLVFKYMIKSLQWGNIVYAMTVEIAKACELDRANVSHAISTLQAADIVVKLKRGAYMINPLIIRKGDNDHGEMTAKYESARRAAV